MCGKHSTKAIAVAPQTVILEFCFTTEPLPAIVPPHRTLSLPSLHTGQPQALWSGAHLEGELGLGESQWLWLTGP